MGGRPSKLARLKRRNRAKRLKTLERKRRKMSFDKIFAAIQDLYIERSEAYTMNPCKVCAKTDGEKPMCFHGEEWCSESHRKIIIGDQPMKRH